MERYEFISIFWVFIYSKKSVRGNGALTHVELVPWALRFSRGGGGVVDVFVAATVAVGPTIKR